MTMLPAILRFAGLSICLIGLAGCAPTAREVAAEIKGIPFGITRQAFYDNVKLIYSNRLSKAAWRFLENYPQSRLPDPVSPEYLQQIKEMHERANYYSFVFPENLLQTDLPKYSGEAGILIEWKYSKGSVSVFFDAQTNYVGFRAFSQGPALPK